MIPIAVPWWAWLLIALAVIWPCLMIDLTLMKLHRLRVEFMDWDFREFPLRGTDAVRCMALAGLCTQAEADAAVAEARQKWQASLSDEERSPFEPDEVEATADREDHFDDEVTF